jgi:pectin methylesterase-like acyl-CoA thioesterase
VRKQEAGPNYELKISHTDPNADFYTLQGAIDFCATHIDLNAPKIFQMDNGIYQEIIYLRDQTNITVKGNVSDNTAVNIQYDNSNDINGGIGAESTLTSLPRSVL